MDINRIVVTMKVFENQLLTGKKQHEFLSDIKSLGIKKVEIRQEFISDLSDELKRLKSLSEDYGIEVIYSVPIYMFKDGEVQMDLIESHLKDALFLNAKMIKFSLGSFDKSNINSVEQVRTLLSKYNIIITVENDQTELSGKSYKLIEFFEMCDKYQFYVKGTFDIGNWYWVGESPIDNSIKLNKYINYIHLKDVVLDESGPKAVPLSEGIIPWQKLVSMFAPDLPLALEFSGGDYPINAIKESIEKLTFLFRMGK